MSIEIRGEFVHLHGRCGIEDAEPLLEILSSAASIVDLTGCDHLHGALLQLLLTARPKLVGEPGPFVMKWIVPLIHSSDSQSGGPMP